MTEEKLIKFLNNQCTDEEIDEIISWSQEDAFNEESMKWGLSAWNSYQVEDDLMDDKKFTLLFDRIQERIALESEKQNRNKQRKLSLITWLTRVAAILLLPLLIFMFYTLSETANIKTELSQLTTIPVDTMEVIVPLGSRTVVQLSDGSVVHLNYGSTLRYPQTFIGNTREVLLIGEGYFEVSHNPQKPFIVKTSKLNVKALGTEFNVMAYSDSDEIETTLVNGKVELETLGVMEPGQHVNYNSKTKEVSSSKGSTEKYTAWKEGKLIFDEASILEVAEKLSRKFNVLIDVKDDMKKYSYTVTFDDEPLFQILDLMTIATPVRYKLQPREKLPDGSYSKQKITFERK